MNINFGNKIVPIQDPQKAPHGSANGDVGFSENFGNIESVRHTREGAQAILVSLLFQFPERTEYIQSEVRRLLDADVDVVDIEIIVSSELKKMEFEINKEKEDRDNMILDPATRNGVTPRNVYEAKKIEALNRRDEAKKKADQAKIDLENSRGIFAKKDYPDSYEKKTGACLVS